MYCYVLYYYYVHYIPILLLLYIKYYITTMYITILFLLIVMYYITILSLCYILSCTILLLFLPQPICNHWQEFSTPYSKYIHLCPPISTSTISMSPSHHRPWPDPCQGRPCQTTQTPCFYPCPFKVQSPHHNYSCL